MSIKLKPMEVLTASQWLRTRKCSLLAAARPRKLLELSERVIEARRRQVAASARAEAQAIINETPDSELRELARKMAEVWK